MIPSHRYYKNRSVLRLARFAVLISLFSALFAQITACSFLDNQEKNEKDNVLAKATWDEDAFTIETIALARGPIAVWHFTKDGTANSAPDTTVSHDSAAGVLIVFGGQSEKRRKRGIFINSWSFAIPNTSEEKQAMTEYLWQLYNNAEWRKSEAILIEELGVECEKRKIPLQVNLSSNLQGKWKKLTNEKAAK